jgi:hypothetical protein
MEEPMLKEKLIRISIFFLSLAVPSLALATPGILKLFIAEYPEVAGSQLSDCRTCHLPNVKNCLNPYAVSLKQNKLLFAQIEGDDADGDSKSNRDEILQKQLPGSQAQANEIFIFTNRMGNITFDHGAHSLSKTYLSSDGNCETCHSDGGFPKLFDDRNSAQKEAHKICKDCHKSSGSEKAPQRCKDCHVKE